MTINTHFVLSQSWIRWILTLLGVFVFGVFVLPIIRTQPASVHKFVDSLDEVRQVVFRFSAGLLVSVVLCNLFSPRLKHLEYFFDQPPVWLACIIGIILVSCWDIFLGLNPDGTGGTVRQWFAYALAPLSIVAGWRYRRDRTTVSSNSIPHTSVRTPKKLVDIEWKDLEQWLKNDEPSDYDFIGHDVVAERITNQLKTGTRSIGIVGRFGCGKTTVIRWIKGNLPSNSPDETELLLTDHNCWGFDDSASAIHDMLEGAISKVGEHIDTFAVGSLPDSYLRLLSAGGNWLETLSNLVLNKAGVEDQFSTLSVLLKSMNTRLVFIIEDLDRNDTRVFDIQEVLRFLQMLKRFDNISFVLTAGINSNARIDFPKLCDRIEYLKTIDSEQIANVVSCLRNRCFDHTHFSFHTTGDDVETPWRHLHWTYGSLSANPNPSQALGRILDTPRALRLTLERTSYDWDNLYGEIDWDHLLVINSLRIAAPEALSFLFRRWSHLCRTPTNTEKERQTHTTIRKMITEDWLTTESNADWDAKSVQALFRVILPPVDYWLDEAHPSDGSRVQGVHNEKYWRRAINESIDKDDISDQIVLSDIFVWKESPNPDAAVVKSICRSERYSDVWANLAKSVFGSDSSFAKHITEHVLSHLYGLHGASTSQHSTGFHAVWSLSSQITIGPKAYQLWIEDRIEEAASVSLKMVVDLCNFWGSLSQSPLHPIDRNSLRKYTCHMLQRDIKSADQLSAIITREHRYTLHQLVFDTGEQVKYLNDIQSWAWLGPILQNGIKNGDVAIAIQTCELVMQRQQGGSEDTMEYADSLVFSELFQGDVSDITDGLRTIADQVDGADKQRIMQIVNSVE